MDEGAAPRPRQSVTPSVPKSATDWQAIAFAVAAGIVGAFQIGKAAIALPALRADLGMGLAAAGWVLGIFNLIGIVAGMALGALIGGWGDRRALLLALLLLAAAGLAGAAAPDTLTLLATRFIEGVFFLVLVIAAPTLNARRAAPADLKLAFGAWGAYMPTGQALMILLGPLILAPFGWRGLWIANSILLALFALLLARATRHVPPPQPVRRDLRSDLRRTMTAPGPLLLAAIFCCYSTQYLAVMGFLPTLLVEQQGLSPIAAGGLGALAVAANGVGNVGAGFLLGRGVRRWRLIAIATIAMLSCGILIFVAAPPLVLTLLLYIGFATLGGMLPASVLGGAPVHAPVPHLVPATNGLIVQGSNLGQVIGPPVIGAIAAAWGWHWAPLLLAPPALAALLLALALRRRERALGL